MGVIVCTHEKNVIQRDVKSLYDKSQTEMFTPILSKVLVTMSPTELIETHICAHACARMLVHTHTSPFLPLPPAPRCNNKKPPKPFSNQVVDLLAVSVIQ